MSLVSLNDTMFQVFIPKKIARDVAELFQLLVKKIGSYEQRREHFDIDYHLLGKGYLWETRFVLGKVILETMGCATLQRGEENVGEENSYMHTEIFRETPNVKLSDLVKEQLQGKKDRQRSVSLCSPEIEQESAKKRKLVVSKCSISKEDITLEKQGVVERGMFQEEHQKINETDELPGEELISVIRNMSKERCQLPDEKAIGTKKGGVKNKNCLHRRQRSSKVE